LLKKKTSTPETAITPNLADKSKLTYGSHAHKALGTDGTGSLSLNI
jgi:hypothetical protein